MLFYALLLYWLDRYEKEPVILLRNVFLWGALVAAGGAFIINTVLGLGIYAATGSETATDFATSTMVAPVVEESLKGFAVFLVFLFYRKEFDSILDGIIYAAITALGFAATENAYYIFNYGFVENGYSGLFQMAFIRTIVVGWQHPFYTAFFGIGLAISRTNRSSLVKFFAPVFGLGFAIFTHAVHNAIASAGSGALCIFGTFLDWSGWIMMMLFIAWLVNRERLLLIRNLAEEVELGTLTAQQYLVACSPVRSSRTRLQAWRTANQKQVNRFFDLCGELAHKKNQYLTMGDESGNLVIIQNLRAEIASLSPVIY